MKPLYGKAYGSIPHLPGSKYGDRLDRGISPAMARYFLEKPVRGDTVYVTEKLDGACVAVARLGGQLVALTRSGNPCATSRYAHHQLFANWMLENRHLFRFLGEGGRVVGEWLALAHGTRYDLKDRMPFVAFDIIGEERISYKLFYDICMDAGIATVPLLHKGGPIGIEDAMRLLGERGHYGACEAAEGAVWRIERRDRFIAIAKYVRPQKNPGCYLPEFSGCAAIWNWPPIKTSE